MRILVNVLHSSFDGAFYISLCKVIKIFFIVYTFGRFFIKKYIMCCEIVDKIVEFTLKKPFFDMFI